MDDSNKQLPQVDVCEGDETVSLVVRCSSLDYNEQIMIDENDEDKEMVSRQKSVSLTSLSTSASSTSDIALIAELLSTLDMPTDPLKLDQPEPEDSQESELTNQEPQVNNLTKENIITVLKAHLEKKRNAELNGEFDENERMTENHYNYDDRDDLDANHFKINEVKSVLATNSEHGSGDHQHYLAEESEILDDDDDSNLPKHLIVTFVPNQVFINVETKSKFEKLFTDTVGESKCKFCYFRIFKRCTIEFDCAVAAILARIQLDDELFMNERIKLYLNKPIKLKNSRPFLEPPKNDKTFLISPPSSPPVGWEQEFEDPPVVNLDLLAALSRLNPLEPCELIKSTNELPGIVIHPCPDLNEPFNETLPRKYMPTRRPAYEFN